MFPFKNVVDELINAEISDARAVNEHLLSKAHP